MKSTKKSEEQQIVRFDWAMKNILRNKANFDILEGFLSELLKEQIKIDSLLESESNQESRDDKFNRVDLLVRTTKGEKIIIEVQTASEWDYWHRILFGTSKVITEYIDKGKTFGTIRKVISVSILFFDLGSGKDYVYKGTTEFKGVHNNDIMQFNEKDIVSYLNYDYKFPADIFPTYYIIQLKKFANIVKDKFDEWVYLLKNESIKPSFSAQGVKSAKEKLDKLKLSEKERKSYEKYLYDLMFERSLIETKHLEFEMAKESLRREGIEEGILRTARSLKKLGADIEIIIASTGLTKEQINNPISTLF